MTGKEIDILLVEDNPADVRLIEEVIADTPHETRLHVTRTGDEALEFVGQCDASADAPEPDVVLLDWKLPTTSGESVLGSINDALPQVPVVVMSGAEPGDIAVGSSTSEPVAVITKPSDPAEYVEVLCSVVQTS